MTFDRRQLELLIKSKSVSTEWPWLNAEPDSKDVENHVKDVVAQLCRDLGVKDKTEYNDYGSGYASYFDCWLYRDTDDFRVSPDRNHYIGLVVLFSRLTNKFSLLEGAKSWDSKSSGSYMPYFDIVDDISHPAVLSLVERTLKILGNRGLRRLTKAELETPLPPDLRPRTVLAEREYRQFDALYYWED